MIKRKISSVFSRNVFKVGNNISKKPTRLFGISISILTILIVIFGFAYLEGSWAEFFNSFDNLGKTLKEMIKWDFKAYTTPNIFGEKFIDNAFKSVLDTIIMSFAGTIVGVIISIPIALCSSNNIVHNKIINGFFKSIMAIFRTIPAFTFALFLIGYFGQTTLSVAIAIAIFTFSVTGKLFYERIESINFNIYRSLQATGASKFRSFKAAIIPQISHNIVSITFYSLETNIRYIAIIGGLSSVGIGQLIQDNISLQKWDRAGFLLFLLIMVVIIMEVLIYVIKKFILEDSDYLLDKRENNKIINKVKKKTRMNNLRFYINNEIIRDFNINHPKNRKSIKEKINYWFLKKMKIKDFKKIHNKLILDDKRKFKELKSKEVNSKKWFIYNEDLSSYVRIDKIYLTSFNIKVEKMKSDLLEKSNSELKIKKEKYLKNLTIENVYKKSPKFWVKRTLFYGLILVFFIYSFSTIEFHIEPSETIKTNNKNLLEIFKINWESLFSKTDSAPYSVISLIFETLSIAIVGTTIGVVFAYILGLLSSETIVNFYIAKFFVAVNSIIRAIPTYIYAIIFIVLVGLGPFNGAIALAMGTIGMLTKYNREIFEDINKKIVIQLQATGLNRLQRFKYGIIPQTSSNIVSYIVYRFDINFKEVSSLGIIGAGNMGYLLNTYFSDHYFHEFGALLFGIIVFTFLIEALTTVLRNKINYNINPIFIDWIILIIKKRKFIYYKANEFLLNQKIELSYDESSALYSYTNKKLFSLSKDMKINNESNSLLKSVNQTFKFYKFDSMKSFIKEYKKSLKVVKNFRFEYLSGLKNEYQENIANIKEIFNKSKDKTEFKKNKNSLKKIYRFKKNTLNY